MSATLSEKFEHTTRFWRFDFGTEEKADYAYAFFNAATNECFAISSLHLLAVVQTLAETLDDADDTGFKFTVRLMKRVDALAAFAPNRATATSQPQPRHP